jgi:hypothetical protein
MTPTPPSTASVRRIDRIPHHDILGRLSARSLDNRTGGSSEEESSPTRNTMDDAPESPSVARLKRRTRRENRKKTKHRSSKTSTVQEGHDAGVADLPELRPTTVDRNIPEASTVAAIQITATISADDSREAGTTDVEMSELPEEETIVPPIDQENGNPPFQKDRPSVQDFYPGPASTSAPWTIRGDTLELFLKPLPKPRPRHEGRGTIYVVPIVQEGEASIVKIGRTKRSSRRRISEIPGQQGQLLQEGSKTVLPGVPLLQLERLEKLVHQELAFFQRIPRNGRKHREYFEVDISVAQRSMLRWWNAMQNLGLEHARELDPSVIDAIRNHPALDLEMSDSNAIAADSTLWSSLNSDHVRREAIWDLVLQSACDIVKLHSPGSMQSPGFASRDFGLMALGFLFVMQNTMLFRNIMFYGVVGLLFQSLAGKQFTHRSLHGMVAMFGQAKSVSSPC